LAGERVETVVERLGNVLAAELGYELIDVEYHKEGPDWVLRCFIDAPDGIGIEDCQRFSEAFEPVLDKEDPIPGSYLLEVSSPGLERTLKKDRDFVRFAGNWVEIKLHQPIDGRKLWSGELLGFKTATSGAAETDQVILLKIDETIIEIPRKIVANARLAPELLSPKGGKRKK
jgi:ribosome maturation factor RimP